MRRIGFLTGLFVLLWAIQAGPAGAGTYYVAPNGSGTTCSATQPCKIAQFWDIAQPGDTLHLLDGVYTGADSMINPPHLYSGGRCTSLWGGAPGAPITIKAENDGNAIIDGQWQRQPVQLLCNTHLVLEGIRAQNSSKHVIRLERSTHITLSRVSGYNGNYHLMPDRTQCPSATYYNYSVLNIYQGEKNLVEDSILGGTGRNLMTAHTSSFNIFRRNVLIGGGFTADTSIPGCGSASGDQHGEPSQMYGSSDNVVENVIAFSIDDWPGHDRENNNGMVVWANTNQQAHRNRYYGTIVMDYDFAGFYQASRCNGTTDSDACLTNTRYENCVAYGNAMNFYSRNGRNYFIKNSSFLAAGAGGKESYAFGDGLRITESFDADKSSSWRFENVLVWGSRDYGCHGTSELAPEDVTFDHVLFYDNTIKDLYGQCSAVNRNSTIMGVDPSIRSIAYITVDSPAQGAGKNGEHIGADTRCRYISRFEDETIVTEHTNQSMWPLPDWLNERVKRESGEIHGTAYDVNAKVLDALVPRDQANLRCLREAPTEHVIRAYYTSAPITVDGLLSEAGWKQADPISFSNPAFSDNQVKVSTLWDDQYFYFAYEVTDVELEATNQQLYRDDGAEIYLDTENNKSTSMDSNDYHFMININDLSDPTGIDVRTVPGTDGYTMEIAIPWGLINTVPSEGKVLGLLLGNNDRDNGSSSQFDWPGLIETGNYRRPYLWGDIVLAGEPVAECTGDLNDDARIDVADLQLMVNIILGTTPETQCADLDGNAVVDIVDLQSLVNRILGE